LIGNKEEEILLKEAEIIKKFNHPNIIKVFDIEKQAV